MSELAQYPPAAVFHFSHKMVQLDFSPSKELKTMLDKLHPQQSLAQRAISLCADKVLIVGSIEGKMRKAHRDKVVALRRAALQSQGIRLPLVNDIAVNNDVSDTPSKNLSVHFGLAVPPSSELGMVLEKFGLADKGRIPVSCQVHDTYGCRAVSTHLNKRWT